MSVVLPMGERTLSGLMTLNVSVRVPSYGPRICSTFLSEVLNWYCYENPEDLSVALSHENYPKRV